MMPSENDNPANKTGVQLGFSVEFDDDDHRMMAGHNLPLWQDWDGGQIGGKPSWLNPKDIPKHHLVCKCCEDPLVFVCQLYCPCDDINPNAFHRSFYVFACPNIECAKETTGTIRVIRTQLPAINPYLPEEEDDECWAMHIPKAWDVNLCKVCGQRGNGKCPVQGEYFCGRHHQKEYKKYAFDVRKDTSTEGSDSCFMPSVLTSSELVVEEEPPIGNDDKSDAKARNTMFKAGNIEDNDSDEEFDRNLEQGDLNDMTGAGPETVTKDTVTMNFFDRINKITNVNTQCLRYLRWPDEERSRETASPLWIRSDYTPNEENISQCEKCGAERRFEFQLMPQMLHYLLKDHQRKNKEKSQNLISKKDTEAVRAASNILEQAPPEQVPPDLATTTEKAMEAARAKIMEESNKVPSWGCVAVYTCTASCDVMDATEDDELGAYIEEFTWKQPSLD
ncbi:unnamed protein product [Pseudo-nitzschia multistriata]|uniref:Programmed cell death protein 2 C-terminal domain-containing protein n=1 Tax=Pseudo-nitzschia multistriata TaxID=183589 RepID=A0A448YUP0_9STRA|nr:unnamed protein product [Pseudo-nitzschia multistriata]